MILLVGRQDVFLEKFSETNSLYLFIPRQDHQSALKKTTMLNNMRAKRLNGLHLTGTSLGPMARLPPKYSDEDWDFNNKVKLRITCDQERMAERIME